MDYSYQNQDDKQGEADKKAKRHRMESDLSILKSDFNKGEGKKSDLEAEIVQMKKETTQIGLDVEVKEEEMEKMENKQRMLGEDIKKMVKKLKLL